MNKILSNIICGFIPSKKLRHKIRSKNKIIKTFSKVDILEENLVKKNKKAFNNKILLIFINNFLNDSSGNESYIFSLVKLLKNLGFEIDFLASDKFGFNNFGNFEELNHKYHFINNFYLSNSKNLTHIKYNYSKLSWIDDDFITLFQNILSKNEYSYILSNYIEMTDFFRFTKINENTKIINIMHDCSTMQYFFNDNNYDEIGINFETEIKLFQYYDDILCISNDEKYIIEKFYKNKNVYWLPHFREFKNTINDKKEVDLLFIGYNNIYNFNSIIWFFEKVYSLINQRINLTICGKVGDMIKEQKPDIYEKMLENNVKFLGFVENLDELYSKTKIAIVPMFDGTGLKIKTITAMSYGLPVVGTYAAIDGFADKTKNPCLISNEPEKLAQYIKNLLNNKEYYKEVSEDTEKYFNEYFSINNAKNILTKVFKE